MDYYVFITRSCNLRCSYCCFGDSVFQRDIAGEKALDVDETADFILRHADRMGEEDNKVFFYGGEPSLNVPWIEKFVERTEGRLRYVLQTNGTRLSSIDPDLLRKLHFLEISIDGVREAHDALRGEGTWARVVANIEAIRPWYPGELAARMTFTPTNPLAESVLFLLEEMHFDHVYWMHEDSDTPPADWVATRREYERELDRLVTWWLDRLREGRVPSIIPFRSVMSSLLEPPSPSLFRCGVGSYLRIIDIDGTCYPCDLMITDDKRHAIGHISSDMTEQLLPRNELYEERCARCEELTFCGGRCFNLSHNRDERFDEFCRRTKILIGKLRAILPEVQELLKVGAIDASSIHISTPLTEQIP